MPDHSGDRFFLYALVEQDRTVPACDPGRWRSDENFLTQYTKDIRAKGKLKDVQAAHSVPSVFGRPILFYQALRAPAAEADAALPNGGVPAPAQAGTSTNPLHDAVVSQWRGLLGVFALQDDFSFRVRAQRYEVPTAEVLACAGDDLNLGTILRNQLPNREADWEAWWLLYCNDTLLGATSPRTIVYTPAEYKCPALIPWQDSRGLLTDPIVYLKKKGNAGKRELAILHEWVRLVLAGHTGHDRWGMPEWLQEEAGTLRHELIAWEADLRQELGAQAAEHLGRIRVTMSGSSPVRKSPYQHFLQGCQVEGPGPVLDQLLKTRHDPRPLVFSREGTGEQSRIYGTIWGDQVDVAALKGPEGDAGWQVRNGREVPLPYVIAEDAFFPPKLVEVRLSANALKPAAREYAQPVARYALPLTPLFFKYFEHADLTSARGKMLKVEAQPAAQGGHEVEVTLRLPLENGGHLTVKKTYRTEDVVAVTGGAPAFAVWPDFYSPDWYANFAAYAAAPGPNILTAPLLEDGTLLGMTADEDHRVRIWQSAKPAIGFSLYFRDPETGRPLKAGLVLRAALRAPAQPDAELTWRIGLDFGTSSTTIMRLEPNGRPELLSLQGRTVLLTEAETTNHTELVGGLYPEKESPSPFVTALARGDATVIGGALKYTPRFDFIAEDAGKLVENIKWGLAGGQIGEEPLKEYLRSLVRYVACEARSQGVRTLVFEWSYPLALPAGVLASMRAFWAALGNSECHPASLTIRNTGGISESEAVCRRLAGFLPIRAQALSIAIDVGGGSTDIGFWSESNLVDQVSMKLAANDVLDPRLCASKDFLKELWRVCTQREWDPSIDSAFHKIPLIAFNGALTQARDPVTGLRFSGAPIDHPVAVALGNTIPRGDPPWSYVRSVIYLFFSGISFYVGLHGRRLVSNFDDVRIYFGGRGSLLLTWLSRLAPPLENFLHNAFERGVTQGSAPPKLKRIEILGPALDFRADLPPKQEVAAGLISPALHSGQIEARQTIIGEEGWRDQSGDSLDFFKEVTAAELVGLRKPSNEDTPHINVFLSGVLKDNWRELNLDEEHLGRLTVDLSKVEDRLKASATKDAALQPAFAWELKVVIDQYIDKALAAAAGASAGKS